MNSETDTDKKQGILSFFQHTTVVKRSTENIKKNNTKDKNETPEPDIIVLEDEIQPETTGTDKPMATEKKDITIPKSVIESAVSALADIPSETGALKTETSDQNDIAVSSILPTSPPDAIVCDLEEGSESLEKLEEKTQQANVKSRSAKTESKESEKTAEKEQKLDEKALLKKQKEEERLRIKREKEEEKQKQKQQKEQEKLKLKAQREELKRKKEEEKQQLKEKRENEKKAKEELKLKAKQERENEKLKREEERRLKEEKKKLEEEAKERSQSRIANFFRKVSDKGKEEQPKSDYQSLFLPFHVREDVIMPQSATLKSEAIKQKISEIDSHLNQTLDDSNTHIIKNWLSSKYRKRGGTIKYKAVTLLQQMTAKDKSDDELQTLLALVPHKYIKFYENVRPPYIGTYSKDTLLPIEDPFSMEGTNYNYDYDSDLEWVNEEEDADGAGIDNLESGEEDDEDDDDDEGSENEFDGFLDKEDSATSNGKKKFVGPLIPTVLLRRNIDTMDADDSNYFKMTAAESLIQNKPLPINALENIRSNTAATSSSSNTSPSKRTSDVANGDSQGSSASPEKKAKSLITDPKDLLKLFDEIQHSTFSLGTVTEITQKSLPNYSKQTIKNTVKEYAVKGCDKGETTKKWQIKDMSHWDQLRSSI